LIFTRINYCFESAFGGLLWLNFHANNFSNIAIVKNASSVKKKFRILVDSDSKIIGVDHLVPDCQGPGLAGCLIGSKFKRLVGVEARAA